METTVCIVGGGPAGALLALLLARAGVEVALLEQHTAWDREFRGELLQPGSVDLLEELGLLDQVLGLPHSKVVQAHIFQDGDRPYFTVPVGAALQDICRNPFALLLPQAMFLPLCANQAVATGRCQLHLGWRIKGLIIEEGRVRGVRCRAPEGDERELRARLVVGCDGRYSVVRREAAGLGITVHQDAAPLDVLQMSLSREQLTALPQGESVAFWLRQKSNSFLALLWPTFWSDGTPRLLFGWTIPHGDFPRMKQEPFGGWRQQVAYTVPALDPALEGCDWKDVNLLSVVVQRALPWWAPGVVLLGDAAHTASPVAGQGMNLALADAATAAEMLLGPLLAGCPDLQLDLCLARLQRRREPACSRVMRLQARAPRFFALPAGVRNLALGVATRVAAWLPNQARQRSRLFTHGFREGWDGVQS